MKAKALFLDRDGVINIDYGYVYQIEKFEFTEGIFELLRLFLKEGYLLFIVTNQSGIGRGYYREEDFQTLTTWMLEVFKKENIHISLVEHCNHAPEEACACRKPQTGMIKNILAKHEIDLENSWLIGDKQSDIDLGINAKIGHTVAIGEREIKNMNYAFKNIEACYDYFKNNKIENL